MDYQDEVKRLLGVAGSDGNGERSVLWPTGVEGHIRGKAMLVKKEVPVLGVEPGSKTATVPYRDCSTVRVLLEKSPTGMGGGFFLYEKGRTGLA